MSAHRVCNLSLRTVLALFLCVLPVTARAQSDVPAPFIAGFLEPSNVWSGTASSLAASLRITPLFPPISTGQIFSVQTSVMAGSVFGLTNLPSAAHSNGGLTGRNLVRTSPGIINRLAAVGTPHDGAPIAQAVKDRVPSGWDTDVAINLDVAVIESTNLDPFFFDIFPLIAFGGVSIGEVVTAAAIISTGIAGALDLSFLPSFDKPVLAEVLPGNPFLVTLNSGANLAAETQQMFPTGRVSVTTRIEASGIVARSVSPNPQAILASIAIIQISALLLRDYYAFQGDPLQQFILPPLWHKVFEDWSFVDEQWLNWIGVLPPGQIFEFASDGLIPHASAGMWGRHSQVPLPEILHRNQVTSTRIRDRLFSVFLNDFGVQLRSGGAPPPCNPTPPEVAC